MTSPRPSTDELYAERILDHYDEPFHRGPCAGCTHAHEGENALCGDAVRIELCLGDPACCRAWFHGAGCCVSQAAASILMEWAEGRSAAELRGLTAEQMLELFGPRLTPARQKCCLLAWRVLQVALESPLQPPPPFDAGDELDPPQAARPSATSRPGDRPRPSARPGS